MQYLFIAGCGRSGTTALLHILNVDERIILGEERFKFAMDILTQDHFKEEHFFNPSPEETDLPRNPLYARILYQWLHDKYLRGGVKYIGDKVPRYAYRLLYLDKMFPGCKILFLLRDLDAVASSFNVRAAATDDPWHPESDYREAIKHWHNSMIQLRRFVAREDKCRRLFAVQYERFYSGEKAYLEALYRFLDLELPPDIIEEYEKITADWEKRKNKPLMLDKFMKEFLDAGKDRELEEFCLSLCPAKA